MHSSIEMAEQTSWRTGLVEMFRGVATRLRGSQADEPEASLEGRLLTMLVGLVHYVVLVGVTVLVHPVLL